jgi:hypothetical protein
MTGTGEQSADLVISASLIGSAPAISPIEIRRARVTFSSSSCTAAHQAAL